MKRSVEERNKQFEKPIFKKTITPSNGLPKLKDNLRKAEEKLATLKEIYEDLEKLSVNIDDDTMGIIINVLTEKGFLQE